MGILSDLKDELTALASAKLPWDKYHRNIAAWVLPQTESFTNLVNTGSGESVMAVTGTPVAAERSKHIYDMTSLWAIDRLTAGLVSLKTPESDYWQDLTIESDFGYEPTHEEVEALERVRDYLFRIRGNPMSGFWGSHKMAVKSMCAFGDGWQFVNEQMGGRTPFTYEFMPIPELYPAVGHDGRPNRMGRVFNWTAHQIATKWPDTCGKKVLDLANDPAKKHNRLRVLHMTRPRSDEFRGRMGVRGAQFASWYCLPDEDHLIGEGGYWEFPFIRYAWSDYGQKAYCEGPVALCIAEILSLQEMAKNELIATQQALRPALATHGKNFVRINFNPGAANPGLINGDGRPLFAPLTAGAARPDFAQAVMESRRNAVREMLYLNLWQILVEEQRSPQETATKSMIRAQEKGEMLGPVGISLNNGLSQLNEREIGILDRKNAFLPGSPLALPESILGANVAPQFTSPLDRLRRSGQVVGVQKVLEFLPVLEGVSPGISSRIDGDEIIELVQDVMGAPARILKGREVSKAASEANAQQNALSQTVTAAAAGGDAMKALGEGGVAAAQGAEAAQQSPALQQLMSRVAGGARRSAA